MAERSVLMYDNISNSLYNIQTNLFQLWTESNVDDIYQKVFLSYLDTLKEEQAKQQMTREYKRMLDNRSQYNKINQLQKIRQKICTNLKSQVQDPSKLPHICIELDKLRKVNLQLVQEIIKLSNCFKAKNSINFISLAYNQLFTQINKDNQGFKNSFLSDYILFSTGYDPFFLYHYQISQRAVVSTKKSQHIDRLFHMNISYVYRLIKAKNQMLKHLSQPLQQYSRNQFQGEYQNMDIDVNKVEPVQQKDEQQVKVDEKAKKKKQPGLTNPKAKVTPKNKKSISSYENDVIKLPKIKQKVHAQSIDSALTRKSRSLNYPVIKDRPSRQSRDEERQVEDYRRNMLLNDYRQSSKQTKQRRYLSGDKNPVHDVRKWNLVSSLRRRKELQLTELSSDEDQYRRPRPLKLKNKSKHYNRQPQYNHYQPQHRKPYNSQYINNKQPVNNRKIISTPGTSLYDELQSPNQNIKRIPKRHKLSKHHTLQHQYNDYNNYQSQSHPHRPYQYRAITQQSQNEQHSKIQHPYLPQPYHHHQHQQQYQQKSHNPNYSNQYEPNQDYNYDSRRLPSIHSPYSNQLSQQGSPYRKLPQNYDRQHYEGSPHKHYQYNQSQPYSPSLDQQHATYDRNYNHNHRHNSPKQYGNVRGNRQTNAYHSPTAVHEPNNANNYNNYDHGNRYTKKHQDYNKKHQDYNKRHQGYNKNKRQTAINPQSHDPLSHNQRSSDQYQANQESRSRQDERGYSREGRPKQGYTHNNKYLSPINAKQGEHHNYHKSPQLQNKGMPQQKGVYPKQQQKQNNNENDNRKSAKQSQNKQMENSTNEKKVLKMKPGTLSYKQLVQYIKAQKIIKKYRDLFEKKQFMSVLQYQQNYLTQFYIGTEMVLFSITFPTRSNNYTVGYWAPLQSCTQKINIFLFKKYLQYLQKFSTLSFVFLMHATIFPSIQDFGFSKDDNKYKRKRHSPKVIEEPQIGLFLSFEFVNISFKQNDIDYEYLYSDQIEKFKPDSCSAGQVSLAMSEPKFQNSQNMHYYHNISTFEQTNAIIQKNNLDGFAYSKQVNISNVDLFFYKQTSSLTEFFTFQQGYISSIAALNYNNDDSMICKLQLQKTHIQLYVGKGFTKVENFIENINMDQKGQKVKASIKCFSKQLYGKITCVENKGMYGNWQINYFWQDQIQGKVKHCLQQSHKFGPDNFYMAIFQSQSLYYAFEVTHNDFLY